MRSERGQSGMSLMELLVAMAVILILISTLIGVGGYVKTRADIDLTKATLETLSTALEKYYADQAPNDFPFDADSVFDEIAFKNLFLPVVADVTPPNSLLEKDGRTPPVDVSAASSAALFYFLDKNPSSRSIAAGVSNSLVTNKGADGTAITIAIGTNPAIDLPRYIDPWKMSIRYEYLTGTAFPVLTSAGPDKIFDTPDDITSK